MPGKWVVIIARLDKEHQLALPWTRNYVFRIRQGRSKSRIIRLIKHVVWAERPGTSIHSLHLRVELSTIMDQGNQDQVNTTMLSATQTPQLQHQYSEATSSSNLSSGKGSDEERHVNGTSVQETGHRLSFFNWTFSAKKNKKEDMVCYAYYALRSSSIRKPFV